MTAKHKRVQHALTDIEAALSSLGLWQTTAPSPDALASTQPFCIDTLTFPQWIQFIFLERMQYLCEVKAALPEQCGIAPMSEEYFRSLTNNGQALTQSLLYIDEILAGH